MAPRNSAALAMIYDREKQKDNANRATLAVARKIVAYLVAVDRRQKDFLVGENQNRQRQKPVSENAVCQDVAQFTAQREKCFWKGEKKTEARSFCGSTNRRVNARSVPRASP